MSDESENENNVCMDTSEEATTSTSASHGGASSRKRSRRGPGSMDPIWEYFTKDRIKNQSICKCVIKGKPCGKPIKHFKTSNCESHLKSFHDDIYKIYSVKKTALKSSKSSNAPKPASKQKTLFECFAKSQKYPENGKRATELTDALIYLIGSGGIAKRIVEVDEFKNFIGMLDPKYALPSRYKITKRIKNISKKIQKNVITTLLESNKISICADIWSRPGLSESYLGISAHFFNQKSHTRQRAFLALHPFFSPHTGERVKEAIELILAKYKIPEEKVFGFVIDNGSNMVKALRLINNAVLVLVANDKYADLSNSDEVDNDSSSEQNNSSADENNTNEEEGNNSDEEEEMDDDTENSNFIDSFAADLNLDRTYQEDDLENEIQEFEDTEVNQEEMFQANKHIRCFAHTLMCALRAAVDRDNNFKDLREKTLVVVRHIIRSVKQNETVKRLSGLKVLLPAATRWNSIYYVFERVQTIKESIDEVCDAESWDRLNWQKIEATTVLLQPFAEYTVLIQGERYPTLPNVIPVLLELQSHLEKQMKVKAVASLAKRILMEIKNRFDYILDAKNSHFAPIYSAATFIDPAIALCLDNNQINAAKRHIMDMASQNNSIVISEQGSAAEPSAACHFPEVKERIRKRRQEAALQNALPEPSSIASEIDLYYKFLMATDVASKAVDFWCQHKQVYPLMFVAAADLLSVPATSGALEGFFSQAAILLRGRYRLTGSNLESELVMHINWMFR